MTMLVIKLNKLSLVKRKDKTEKFGISGIHGIIGKGCLEKNSGPSQNAIKIRYSEHLAHLNHGYQLEET